MSYGANLVEPGVQFFFRQSLKKCHEFKDKYYNIYYNIFVIVSIFVIIGVIVLIATFHKKKAITKFDKKEVTVMIKPKLSKAHMAAKDWIARAEKSGMSQTDIISQLKNQGWSDEDLALIL